MGFQTFRLRLRIQKLHWVEATMEVLTVLNSLAVPYDEHDLEGITERILSSNVSLWVLLCGPVHRVLAFH